MCIAGGKIETSVYSPFVATSGGHARPVQMQLSAFEHLFFEGDRLEFLHIIESGWVKLYRTMVDGQRQVVGFANAGSILGLESAGHHANGCEAITPVRVRTLPVSSINDLCRRDPALAETLLRQVGRQLGAAQSQLASVGAQTAEQKIATFLLSIADLCGAGDTGDFDLPMRRGDMAEFLGLRLETVSRKITDFQRRGWISITSLYHCRINRRSALKALADGGHVTTDCARAS